MGKYQELLHAILLGRSDQNIAFSDLLHLLRRLGFDVRIKEGVRPPCLQKVWCRAENQPAKRW
jgi:uroporphyrinogen-III decarboxylase